MNMNSILTSIKKLLGISEDDTNFDVDIIIHINSALMVVSQLGAGVPKYAIRDSSDEWSDFISSDANLELVKSYVYLKVKLIFDPPPNASAIESMERQIEEYEWRINVEADTPQSNGMEVLQNGM